MLETFLIFGLLACLAICATILLLILKCLKGITVTVNVNPVATIDPPAPVNIAAVQESIDKLEEERRKEQMKLDQLIGNISDFMTGGIPNGK